MVTKHKKSLPGKHETTNCYEKAEIRKKFANDDFTKKKKVRLD